MKTIKNQLDAGRVNDVIAGLKPYRRRSEAVAACIRTYEANNDRMHYDLWRKRGLPVGSGVAESACKRIVGSRFNGAECPTGRRQEPTPCSPSNAISRTTVGPTSSIRGLAVPQPPDQKT